MATRTVTFAEWWKLLKRHLGDDSALDNVAGLPQLNVAQKLNVSRERVGQLVREGVLDTLEITNAAGRVSMTLVTYASIERYLAERTPDRNRQGYFAFAPSRPSL